ncbi:T9SS C-terminal target domain-containing protein [Aquimarina sp. AD1]|uniref:T9SS type A sorting domain-containing protein n=1 Tax=Aquimarina sp. (strain AD1) TaxID=1714848 RepID=UPI000E47D9B5|nr:T9SS type A sorting domain-containing protein [Aquimarina sp. AD1]AXT57974.1 T9SS C-terminal target domain-containing protein [Aquimarina sp. AD1]RKN27898.1 T9SS C-terminal target domain-containing protein [Aquimarina sp. AD1]
MKKLNLLLTPLFLCIAFLTTSQEVPISNIESNDIIAKVIGKEDKVLHMSANLVVDEPEDLFVYIDRAKAAGANTVLYSDSKLNTYGLEGTAGSRWDERIQVLVDGIKERGMKLHFITISMGFAGSLIASNPNLTTGYPIEEQKLKAIDGELRPIKSSNLINGDFEDFDGNKVLQWKFQDAIGERTFIDTNIKKSGNASFRAEATNNEDSRIFTVFDVKPFHQYTLKVWIKTENLTARNLAALIRDENNKDRTLTNLHISLPNDNGGRKYYNSPNNLTTEDWEEIRIGFNSLNATEVNLALAVFGGQQGTIWWDDLEIIDSPTLNWLNREDLPTSLKHNNGQTLTFGTDVAPISDDQLGVSGFSGAFDTQHLSPKILISSTTNIKEGDIVKISGYHGLPTASGQVSASWNHPEIYSRMRRIHQKLSNDFEPDGFLLNYSEIRTGGWEPLDTQIGNSGAALSASIQRSFKDLFEVAPDAAYYFWSDMIDPEHNAIADYYQINNTLDQSWVSVDPNKVILATWWEGQKIIDKGTKSLKFFSDLGFKQIVGAFYDADVELNFNQWQTAAQDTENIIGSIYATWVKPRNYTQIENFGSLWWSQNQANDEIVSIDGPDTISPGGTGIINLEYSASATRDIIVSLQLNRAPWTNYGVKITTVPAGTNNIEIEVVVNEDIPIADNDYKWLSYIVPENENWNNRFDDLQEINISAINNDTEIDISGTLWRLENKATKQWIRTRGCSNDYSEITPLVMTSTNNTGNCTIFEFIPTDEGYYYLQNKGTNGRYRPKNCSNTANDSIEIVQVSSASFGWCEQWKLIETDEEGYFRIQNRQTNNWIRSKGCSANIDESIAITQVSQGYTGNCTKWKLIDTSNNQINRDFIDTNIDDIKLFPNPANSEISIQKSTSNTNEIVAINIYDLQGRKQLTVDSQKLISNGNNIEVSHLTTGMYILSVDYHKKETQNLQFMISH